MQNKRVKEAPSFRQFFSQKGVYLNTSIVARVVIGLLPALKFLLFFSTVVAVFR